MGRLYGGAVVDCAYMHTKEITNCNADFATAIDRGWIFQELSNTKLHACTWESFRGPILASLAEAPAPALPYTLGRGAHASEPRAGRRAWPVL